MVRRIDVSSNVKHVIWSEDGTQVILALEETMYQLEFHADVVSQTIQSRTLTEEEKEDGLEEAFTFAEEFAEVVVSGLWVS